MKHPRLNILAFSFFPAIVPATSGGETRLYELYSALSRHHNVRLISSAWHDRPTSTIRHGANFREIQVQKHPQVSRIYSELSQITSSSADISGPAVYLGGLIPSELHEVYFQQYGNADVVIHDSPFTISYDVMAGIDTLPRIYNSYNCETQLYSQMHSGVDAQRIVNIVREAEQRLLEVSDLVTCCSEDDQELLIALANRPIKTAIIPNGGVPRRPREIATTSVLKAVFVGSQHYPNREAASFISQCIAPKLPDIEFYIVGNCLDAGDQPENVRRLGFLSDEEKDIILRSCDIALNPMSIGSGSSLKVTEYLSYGLPIISTRFGVRGLGLTPGQEYLEADRINFVNLLTEIEKNRAGANQIGENALSYFRNTLTWPSIASDFSNLITSSFSSKPSENKTFVLGLNDYDFTTTMSGGATRIRGLYEQMRRERTIIYIVITDSYEWSIDKSTHGFTVLRVPKAPDHRKEEQRINSEFHLSAADIVNLYMLPSNSFLVYTINYLKKNCICIVTDHIYTSGLVSEGDDWIYSSQNYETALKTSVLNGHPSYDLLINKVKDAETRALQHAAAVICVTEDDAKKMTAGRNSSVPTIVIPNGVMPPNYQVQREHGPGDLTIRGKFCLFVASAHPPNVEACNFLLNEVAPKIPEVEFHIIGGVCENFASGTPPNVILWGKLSEAEKSTIMGQAHLALNPVDSGGGSNIKIADYFSYGLPVISTSFGVRGFPNEVASAVTVASRAQFAERIRTNMEQSNDPAGFELRRRLFDKHLNAVTLGKSLADLVSSMRKKRKKLLYVTYRMTYPPRGGAEAHLLKIVEYLSSTGDYEIDVVSPAVDFISDTDRFGALYKSEPESSGPYGFPNVHWAKFPLDDADPTSKEEGLIRIWEAQAAFDRLLMENVPPGDTPALLWGWSSPEIEGEQVTRWAFSEAALYTPRNGHLTLTGSSIGSVVISSTSASSTLMPQHTVDGEFTLELNVDAGVFSFQTSAAVVSQKDPRPLGILIRKILFEGIPVEGYEFDQLEPQSADDVIATLSEAASKTRRGCSLSAIRGPFSSSLEQWLEQNMDEYDLLMTHNNIFLPVALSLEIAASCNVPSVLIPHVHLDDDYYHFPDLEKSVKLATAVLAAPSQAVEYLKRFNPAVYYHSPGLDVDDLPGETDICAFKDLYASTESFCLVLGRKASAKNYQWAIESAKEAGISLILIGPDDDGLQVEEPHVRYLGQQPRSVVRGALASCLFLVNMSSSESFGMVVLEAWLSKRPVIVNRNCAAFNDLVGHGVNGLLATRTELTAAMRMLVSDETLRQKLGTTGLERALAYDWRVIGRGVDDICKNLMINH